MSEAKLDLLLQKFEVMEARMVEMNENLGSRIGSLETRMESFETRMGSIETRMESIETRIGSLETRMESIETRMGSLETRMESLESGQKELNLIVTAIRDRQDEADARFEALSFDIHRILGELSELKKGQERQDKILEALALRSLEQETDIRELKRIK
ncbi:hypothetical protein [Paenibacillus arenilitoris]|uniref:Uncharacterized protein n=1 Tax=Paenibacillus arenilitoris TaxID=2772299 RepID=A0A927H5C8_9BACL|nr:hypothetical protein [Paenibacillus arenilitoris]MBD2868398.1 hypothetical protein [Paenibacillus arenilitoris]